MTKIHAVIVHYRTLERTTACLDALGAARPEGVELDATIVDNGSRDGSSEKLQDYLRNKGCDWAHLVEIEDNRGLGAGLNHGLRPALRSGTPPDFVLILHPDTCLRPDALELMLGFLKAHPSAGMVGPRFVSEAGEVFSSAFRFPSVTSELVEGLSFGPVTRLFSKYEVAPAMRDVPHETPWLSGAAILARREVFDTLGSFDEAFFLDFGDVDFGMRAYRAGWVSWYLPRAEAVHRPVGGDVDRPARRPEHWFAGRKRYFEKHYGEPQSVLADVVFASTLATSKARRKLTGHDDTPPHLVGDVLRFGFRRLVGR